MPFQRPVSPVTFETCSPPPTKNINDPGYDFDLLGSDDELDEERRAAKRRKVENLAQSYLRGNQLFILSASLRGPFEGGWTNPWKKTRKTRSAPDAGLGRSGTRPGFRAGGNREKTGVDGGERVVQETDPRVKFRGDLERGRPEVMKASVGPEDVPQPSSRDEGPVVFGSARKSGVNSAVRHGRETAPSRSVGGSGESSMSTTEDQSVGLPRTAEWLKKDRKRMDFRDYEPPSSPTPRVGLRHAEKRLRGSASRDTTPGRSVPPVSAKPTLSPHRAAGSGRRDGHYRAGSSLQEANVSHQPEGHAGSSFRVISSSSQLPRFEYRRRYQKSPPVLTAEKLDEPGLASAAGNDDGTSAGDALNETNADVCCIEANAAEQSDHQSKDLRFAEVAGAPKSTDQDPQVESEPETSDNLPSAQQLSALDASTRIPSLHSTVLPITEPEQPLATSPDTQLSTQAALLHAQKDFQNDLESPQIFARLPEQPPDSPPGDDSVLLARETPNYQPTTAERSLLRNSRHLPKGRMQAMSTQCMLDAASPYTFSTEKKPNAFRAVSPHHPKSQNPRTLPGLQDSPNRPDHSNLSSPSPENEYQPAQSSRGGSNPRERVQSLKHNQPPTHRSTTQGTALSLTMSASPPTTVPDGQGGLQPVQSFDLSQAMADAGSWLQQSIDFLKEIRQPSQ